MGTGIEYIKDERGRDYSEAIRAGQFIFVAGQCALDENDQVVGVGDFEAQVRYTFKLLGNVLARSGASWANVVKTSKIFKEMSPENLAAYQRVRRETCSPPFPSTIGVQSDLMFPELLFEMDAIAFVPE